MAVDRMVEVNVHFADAPGFFVVVNDTLAARAFRRVPVLMRSTSNSSRAGAAVRTNTAPPPRPSRKTEDIMQCVGGRTERLRSLHFRLPLSKILRSSAGLARKSASAEDHRRVREAVHVGQHPTKQRSCLSSAPNTGACGCPCHTSIYVVNFLFGICPAPSCLPSGSFQIPSPY